MVGIQDRSNPAMASYFVEASTECYGSPEEGSRLGEGGLERVPPGLQSFFLTFYSQIINFSVFFFSPYPRMFFH